MSEVHWRAMCTLPTDGTVCIVFYEDLSGSYLVRFDGEDRCWLEYRGTHQLWFPIASHPVCGIGWIPFPEPELIAFLEKAAANG